MPINWNANPLAFRNTGSWRIWCRDTTAVGAILFTLGFVFTLIGIGVLPAAYADSMPEQCPPDKKTTQADGGGGEAEWQKCTKDGFTEISGHVKDTAAADGKCAQVVIYFDNGFDYKSEVACSMDAPKPFRNRQETDGARVKVQVV